MTCLEKLLEKFPNTLLEDVDHTPRLCPHDIGLAAHWDECDALEDCRQCWNRPAGMTYKEYFFHLFPYGTKDENKDPCICLKDLGWGADCDVESGCHACWNRLMSPEEMSVHYE